MRSPRSRSTRTARRADQSDRHRSRRYLLDRRGRQKSLCLERRQRKPVRLPRQPQRPLTALGNTPTAGTVVAAASADGRFLYAQTGDKGIVDVFRINRDGSLTGTESVTVPGGVAGEGIVVARARPTPRCPPAARNLPAVGGRLGRGVVSEQAVSPNCGQPCRSFRVDADGDGGAGADGGVGGYRLAVHAAGLAARPAARVGERHVGDSGPSE